MIDSLIKKELNELNILWIPSNSKHFEKLFDSLDFNYFDLSDLFTGLCTPNLIITNNRFSKFDIVINLCLTNHCNLIIIDHDEKPDIISTDKIISKMKLVPNVLQIATSPNVYNSWGKIHDIVLESGITKEDFSKILTTFYKKIFKVHE